MDSATTRDAVGFVYGPSDRVASATRRGPLRAALRWTTWTVLGGVVLVFAALALLPLVTSYRTTVITGRSMTGAFSLGSVVVTEPIAPAAIRTGDVISFDRPDQPGTLVTHRVTSVRTGTNGRPAFRTKGDANAAADPWEVQYVDTTGWRVVRAIPHVGRVTLVAFSPAGRLALVVAPVAIFLALTIIGIWRTPRREQLAA